MDIIDILAQIDPFHWAARRAQATQKLLARKIFKPRKEIKDGDTLEIRTRITIRDEE